MRPSSATGRPWGLDKSCNFTGPQLVIGEGGAMTFPRPAVGMRTELPVHISCECAGFGDPCPLTLHPQLKSKLQENLREFT